MKTDKLFNCITIISIIIAIFIIIESDEIIDIVRQRECFEGLKLIESFNYAVSLPDYLK